MDTNMFRIDGDVAIVTGGSRGIGRAICLGLAAFGADVAVCSRNVANCAAVAREIEEMGRRALAIGVDVSRPNEVSSMVEKARTTFGKLDILVNNAGIGSVDRVHELSEEMWDSQINLNLKGTFLCCQAVGKVMMSQKRGNIVNISSMMGSGGSTGYAAYGVSKAGIDQLTRVLAVEWSKYNIRVNALAPGWVSTDMNQMFPVELREKLADRVPMKRFATPEEMVSTVLYLVSHSSSYTTGAIIYVDGGSTAKI